MSKEEWFRKLLARIAEKENYKNYELIINEISSGGANYTSKLYPVTIKEAGKDSLHLFGKVGCIGEKFRSGVEEWKIYTTEHFFYTRLAGIYNNIEEECNVPEEHRLGFAKCYGYDTTLYRETIILEDLAMQGYGCYDRFKSVDWPHASAAINELAKMHALSFAFSKKDPVTHSEILEELHFKYEGEVIDVMMKNNSTQAFEKVKQENREVLKKYWDKYESLFSSYPEPVSHTIITHGDYRPNNLMHKVREDGTVDIKILDLQTMQGSSPVVDLLYFIFTGSDEEFRAQYYDQLVDHYYTQLHDAMKRLNLDPEKVYSRQDFDNELKEKLPFGLAVAIFTLPIVTVDVEDAPKVNEDLDFTGFSIKTTNDLYKERLNGVVNDYVKWGILK